jgi:hypothetical protein
MRNCPITQIRPPTTNAIGMFTFDFEGGEALSLILLYISGVILMYITPSAILSA